MRAWLGKTWAQVVTAIGALLLIVGVVAVIMVISAPGPEEQLANALNSVEGCASIETRYLTAPQAMFTPVPLGLAEGAQQRVELLCGVPGSGITFFSFPSANSFRKLLAADPLAATSHACTYAQRYLLVDDGPWDANERSSLIEICKVLHARRLGLSAVWRPAPSEPASAA